MQQSAKERDRSVKHVSNTNVAAAAWLLASSSGSEQQRRRWNLKITKSFAALTISILGLTYPERHAAETLGIANFDEGSTSLRNAHQPVPSPQRVPKGLAASDWAGIRAAYQAHRHAAVRTATGYQARNPGQQWLTEFDGRSFITRPDAGGWQWGLELKSYGFAGHKQVISGHAEVTVEEGRVTYRRDARLREWFVNDPRGLEHGFTVEQPPPHGRNQQGADLEFDLVVRGNLRPEILSDGGGLRFLDAQGGTALTYSGLRVWDANGKDLGSHFVAQPDGVRLMVETAGARYPITIDPIAQQAYLKASNAEASDFFGRSVAISGDTVVIGATSEASAATGVNGNQTDNSANQTGAAYVFVRNGAGWTQQAYLKASNHAVVGAAGYLFGWSVAISGDTVVVGAIREDGSATGINGVQNHDAKHAGAAYVFVRNGTTWTQQAYLKASNTGAGDAFGGSVAISGNTIVVGAQWERSDATGVNGAQTKNNAREAGAAYVFVRTGTTWAQQAYLKASNTEARDDVFGDQFGFTVAISGNVVAVGANLEDSNATGINGDQNNNGAEDAGAVYVFIRNNNTWAQQAYLKASNAEASDLFGSSLALSADTLVVGAHNESSSAVGINGDQANNNAFRSGAAYVFVRNTTTWTQQAYLKASNTENFDGFSGSIAISGETVVIGAPGERSNSTGVNGDQTNNSIQGAGAVYVFTRNSKTWSQQAYLKSSETRPRDPLGDNFGASVAISGDTVIVGAGGEDSNAVGINGDPANNSANNAGAAYIFSGLGPAAPQSQAVNIATRMRVLTGDSALIGGFIITGNDPKRVIIRGIGPSTNIPGALGNPTLELFDSNQTLLGSNDDWKSNQAEVAATTIPPTKDLESAIVRTLAPGAYTAVLRGKNNTTGIGVVEVYDLNSAANSTLANISSRGFVDTGDNVMIGGFIVGGEGAGTRVLIRGIGPSLASFFPNALANPTLELRDGNGSLIRANNNWRDSQEAEIQDTTIPPSNNLESAIVASVAKGNYTAILRGAGNTTGVAVVEVYNLQ
jgi:hypothetical protein